MTDWQLLVEQFHREFGCTIGGNRPAMLDRTMRARLIIEECNETVAAIGSGDLPSAVDGLADLIYVCLGSAVAWGVDLRPIFEAVHWSNMAKKGGGARADGKILKPPGWQPPDVEGELRKQGWEP